MSTTPNSDSTQSADVEAASAAAAQETATQEAAAQETPVAEKQAAYVAPEVKNLSGKAPAPAVAEKPAETAAPVKIKEATFEKGEGVIGLSKMVNARGTVTTDIMIERIQKHMQHLSGKLGFNNKEERIHEQVTFIETVGNSLRLDFDQFVLVTDVLLNAIKEHQPVFEKGLAFRFMGGLDKNYPADYIRTYQAYISFLSTIAKNWAGRAKLANQVDIGYVTKDFPQKAKENINQYFRRVISA